MPDILKVLDKKVVDLEKRIKMLEAKVKTLADNMTDPKQIQQFAAVIKENQTGSEKEAKRLEELGKKHAEAEAEKARKEAEKMIEKHTKEAQKLTKDMITKAEFQRLEALVNAALARR